MTHGLSMTTPTALAATSGAAGFWALTLAMVVTVAGILAMPMR